MASQRKVIDEENAVAKGKSGLHPVRVDEQANDVMATLTSMFQAPLGTKIHDKRQDVHRMRGILHNPKYMDGDRLSPGDEIAVRDVLKYHPNCEQKTGPGIAYIKQKLEEEVSEGSNSESSTTLS